MFYDLQLKTALAYIESRVDQPLEAADIAQATGYAPDYFRQLFKQGTGHSLKLYIRLRRLSHAAFELRNTKRNVMDIALNHGFASHDAFTRAFRRMFGRTPSQFRQSGIVKGQSLIPGVMAPVVLDYVNHKEEWMMQPSQATQGSMVLYGVPRVSYFDNPPKLTPFIASLEACLNYIGHNTCYARLMAASGAGFRLMWNTEYLDGGNVDIMAIRTDPMEPIRRAIAAAGISFTLLEKKMDLSNKAQCIQLIRSQIDAGRPVIGFGIIGPPEACIITGYRENGEVLLGWNFFQGFPEWQAGLEFDPCGYFIRRGWYEHPETLAFIALEEDVPTASERTFLLDTVRYALEIMTTPKVGPRAGGADAYEAWACLLEDDAQFSPRLPLAQLMERLMCHMDAINMVCEGRWYAESFFEHETERLPALKQPLLNVAAALRAVRESGMLLPCYTEGMGMGEPQARALQQPENRKAMAAIIRKCAELEKQAIAALEHLAAELENPSAPELDFQPIHPEDIDVLTRVMTAAFDDDTKRFGGQERGGPPGYDSGDFFRQWVFKAGGQGWKALIDGEIVGAAIVFSDTDGNHVLGTIFVDPAFQGMDIGTCLWQWLEKRYSTARTWRLNTPAYATRNHHFYQKKCGFTFYKAIHEEGGCPGGEYVFIKKMMEQPE